MLTQTMEREKIVKMNTKTQIVSPSFYNYYKYSSISIKF